MDKIFYIKNGEILEEGNHATLMKLNGEYAKMFTIQAERYGL
jgi:ATP-binding cassette subfamily B protein